MAREPVILNIYDMYCMNDFTTLMGFGLFHSGIEVYGVEYAYGGHPYSFSGIFDTSPKNADDLGPQFRFRQSIQLGRTEFTEEEVARVVTELGDKYAGDQYNLLNKNCNHFSQELSQILCGSEIPPWVNRIAYLSCMPFIRRWLRKIRSKSISWQHMFA